MTLPVFSRNELIDLSSQREIILATANQIIKDFAEFGLDITFSGNTNNFYSELFSQMEQHVAELMANQHAKFFNFLYRIDISNKDIELYEKELVGKTSPEILTELIIHREIKKILYRKYYSNHSKK